MYKAATGEIFHDKEEYEIVRELRESTADLLLDYNNTTSSSDLKSDDVLDLYFTQKRKRNRHYKNFDQQTYDGLIEVMNNTQLNLSENMVCSMEDRYMTDHCFDSYCESIPDFSNYQYTGSMFTDSLPSRFENTDDPTFYDTINEMDEETALHKIMSTVTETPPKVIKIGDSIKRNIDLNTQIYNFYVEEMLSNYFKTHDNILKNIFDAIENHKSMVIQADDENAIVAKW